MYRMFSVWLNKKYCNQSFTLGAEPPIVFLSEVEKRSFSLNRLKSLRLLKPAAQTSGLVNLVFKQFKSPVGVLQISSDRDDRIRAKIKTITNLDVNSSNP